MDTVTDEDVAVRDVRLEREKIHCWLHDTVLQTLEYIASGGYGEQPMSPDEVKLIAGRAADDLRDTLTAWEQEEPLELLAALQEVVDEANSRSSCHFELSVGPIGHRVSGVPAESLAGAVREALNNVQKHARAARATVYCETGDTGTTVRVEDDGCGFSQDDSPVNIGIRRSIVGRVVQAGGSAVIRSQPGAGTRLELSVPGSGTGLASGAEA